MTEGRRAPDLRRRALLLAGTAACLPVRAQPRAQPRAFRLGLLTQGDDERYSPQTLQRGFPDGRELRPAMRRGRAPPLPRTRCLGGWVEEHQPS